MKILQELTGAIIAYKPLMDQFEQNVKALQEICIEEDGVKLGELAEEIVANEKCRFWDSDKSI
uniref:DUF2281 domain-containing protein n=1 Tax=Heterorhabditis bacteriophora TaxID=37862 RepID=A0A1I7XGJ5_HETBA